MGSVAKAGKICAFCTSSLAYGKPERASAFGLLLRFYKEVILEGYEGGTVWSRKSLLGDLPNNWTVCVECLPSVEGVMVRKEKVDRREKKVRNLQTELLKELNGLWGEVDRLQGELGKIERIMQKGEELRELKKREERSADGGRISLRKGVQALGVLKEREHEEVTRFRDKVEEARSRYHGFTEVGGRRLLKNYQVEKEPAVKPKRKGKPPPKSRKPGGKPDTPVKREPEENQDEDLVDAIAIVKEEPEEAPEETSDAGMEDELLDYCLNDFDGDDGGDSRPESEEHSDNVNGDTKGDVNVKQEAPPQGPSESTSEPAGRTRRKPPVRKNRWNVKADDETGSSEEYDDSSDDDFIPEDRSKLTALAKTNLPPLIKYVPIFRRNLITRIRERASIATHKNSPTGYSDPPDPRQGHCVTFNSRINKFFLGDTEILCLDQEQTLQCTLCPYRTPKYDQKKEGKVANPEDHMFDHILGKHLKVYRCNLCSLTWARYGLYRNHMQVHKGTYPCTVCGKPLSGRKRMKTHMWSHLNSEEKQDPANQHLMPYSEKHKDLLQEKRFQCSTCGKAFKSKRILDDHQLVHDETREKLICSQCGVQLFKTSLALHLRKFCGKEKGVECKVCQNKLQNEKALWKHMFQEHRDARPYACEVCGKAFMTKPKLLAHKGVHDEVGKYICKCCGTRFKQNRNLKRHEMKCGGTEDRRRKGAGGGGPREKKGKVKEEMEGKMEVNYAEQKQNFAAGYFM